jgi:CDGSH-type Zn-finger protein
MSEVTVTVRENGPYEVKGPIRVIGPDGRELRDEREVVTLCRCGGSSNKPFCDGTHLRNGFTAPSRAEAADE